MKKSLIVELFTLAAALIIGSGICMMAYMGDRVDFKYCSDNGSYNYYTVKGSDTTYYRTSWQVSLFGCKWVRQVNR